MYRQQTKAAIQYLAWEFEQVPGNLIKHLQRTTRELWVPSTTLERAVRKLGYMRDMVVMPWPVDKCLTPPQHTDSYYLSEGAADAWHAMEELVVAFTQEFSGVNTTLVLLLNRFDRQVMHSLQEAVFASSNVSGLPRVLILASVQSRAKVYGGAAGYIHVAKSGAALLPVHQALACGLPVAVPASSAAREVLANYALAVRFPVAQHNCTSDSCPRNPLTNKPFVVMQQDITVDSLMGALGRLRNMHRSIHVTTSAFDAAAFAVRASSRIETLLEHSQHSSKAVM